MAPITRDMPNALLKQARKVVGGFGKEVVLVLV